MRRKEFLKILKEELKKRRDIESEEVLFYYDELIQDAVDNGESEEVFILNLGNIRDIIRRIEDDKEFIIEVKRHNSTSVRDVLSKSVKVIGYIIFGILAFSIGVTGISLFISGIAIVITAIVKMLVSSSIDLFGYLAWIGVALIGSSLAIFSFGLVKWFFNQAKPALLAIFRNTNQFINKWGNK